MEDLKPDGESLIDKVVVGLQVEHKWNILQRPDVNMFYSPLMAIEMVSHSQVYFWWMVRDWMYDVHMQPMFTVHLSYSRTDTIWIGVAL